MFVPSLGAGTLVPPNIHLGGTILKYVETFRYLGHIITRNQSDEQDMLSEVWSLCFRGNMLVNKFSFCTEDIKCCHFSTFCYSLYGSSLCSQFMVYVAQEVKVCFNTIFRKFVKIPPWISPSNKFVECGILSYWELVRRKMYSIMSRIKESNNSIIDSITNSDVISLSCMLNHLGHSSHIFDLRCDSVCLLVN